MDTKSVSDGESEQVRGGDATPFSYPDLPDPYKMQWTNQQELSLQHEFLDDFWSPKPNQPEIKRSGNPFQ